MISSTLLNLIVAIVATIHRRATAALPGMSSPAPASTAARPTQ